MKIEQLKLLPAAEVAQRSHQQAAAARTAKQEYDTEKEKADTLSLAVTCHSLGFWPGDTVRVNGKYSGKQNPLGIFVGLRQSLGWIIVRLLKKDGSPSEVLTEIYRRESVTKA